MMTLKTQTQSKKKPSSQSKRAKFAALALLASTVSTFLSPPSTALAGGPPGTRYIGVFDTAGRPALVDVRRKIKDSKLVVPAGHLANPNLEIPKFTRLRYLTLSSTVEGILPAADEKFASLIAKLRSQPRLIELANRIAPLYGVEPAAVMGAMLGELTFNNEFTSAMQDKAALIPEQSSFTGAIRVAEKLKADAFEFCGIKHRDYWAWVCVNRTWNNSLAWRGPQARESLYQTILEPSDQPLHGMLRPTALGATFGPAQMSLMRALMLSEDVYTASGGQIPRLWIDDMPAVLRAITNLETSVHFVAATLARSIDAYKRFANIDISHNMGVQATLFNLGWEFELALKSRQENTFNKIPNSPRENYFGWFINRHEKEIRELVSKAASGDRRPSSDGGRTDGDDAQLKNVFRDDLFTNRMRPVLQAEDKGAKVIFDWNYQESVLDRDAVEGTVAKSERIDSTVTNARKEVLIRVGNSDIDASQVGEIENAKFAVIFIHGGGGATKTVGSSDVNFGGNFNHIQSLALHNGGVYLSPTVNLTAQGDLRIPELIEDILERAPTAKIILSCGSAGSYVCWQVATSSIGPRLSGLILLGGSSFDPNFLKSAAARARVPVLFSHGTRDPLVPLSYADQYYQAVRSIARNYPVRFEAYNGGKHGTPIRLVDWKTTLEWMFQSSRK